MPMEDMEIISAAFAGSVIREGFGKLSTDLVSIFFNHIFQSAYLEFEQVTGVEYITPVLLASIE